MKRVIVDNFFGYKCKRRFEILCDLTKSLKNAFSWSEATDGSVFSLSFTVI